MVHNLGRLYSLLFLDTIFSIFFSLGFRTDGRFRGSTFWVPSKVAAVIPYLSYAANGMWRAVDSAGELMILAT